MTINTKKPIKNQRIAREAFQKTKAQARAVVQNAVQTVATHYADATTRANELIQTGKRTAVRFFQNVAADYEKCRPVEVLCSYYMEELEKYRPDIPAPIYDNLLTQLKAWRATQMERVLQGKEIEAFEGLNQLLATSMDTGLFNFVQGLMSATPSSLAIRPTASTIVGGSSLTDTPVWDTNDYGSLNGLYRTAVMEHFVSGLEVMRPQTGKMDPVKFTPPETAFKTDFHATTMEQWLPLPTQLADTGYPQYIYSVDSRVGRIHWSATQGQFYLELLQRPTSPQRITIAAYENNDHNQWLPRLTPHTANLPASKPNETIKAALSPVTRKIFEAAEKMGRQDLYGNFALTKFEQLQYAAARLRGSWTYNRRPKHLDAAKADGARWLSHLHQVKEVTTANCNVANTEFAVAARAFGYPVRIVTGFLGTGRPALDAPGHEWVEVRVGNAYREIDATPGFKLEDQVTKLGDDIQRKLRMIAEYNQNPKYHERDAIYAQLSDHLDAASLGKLFGLLSALPIEEERMDNPVDNQDRRISGNHVWISHQMDLDRWHVDVYEHDPLQPHEQGRYRGYLIANKPLYYLPLGLLYFEGLKKIDHILEWHIDNGSSSSSTHDNNIVAKVSPIVPAIIGTMVPGSKESYNGSDVVYITVPGYPAQRFRACRSIDEIQEVWDPKDNQGRSTLVEGLQHLHFVPVRVEEAGSGRVDLYIFNAKTGLLINSDINTGTEGVNMGVDAQGKRWQIRTSSDYTRILATEITTITFTATNTNHADTFAQAFFEHMQGKPVTSAADRGLLAQALSLLLRHPPEMGLKHWNTLASVSYLLSEGRRLKISTEEIQNVSATSAPASPKAVICDGITQATTAIKSGCDVIWSKSPPTLDPNVMNGLWLNVISAIGISSMGDSDFDSTTLSPAKRAWMEKLFQQHFKSAEK